MHINLVISSPKVRNFLSSILIAYLLLLGFVGGYVAYSGGMMRYSSDFEPDELFQIFYAIMAIPFGTDLGPLSLIAAAFPVVITTVSKKVTLGPPPVVSNDLSRTGEWVVRILLADALLMFAAIIIVTIWWNYFKDELGGPQPVEHVKTLVLAAEAFLVFYIIDLLGIKI